MDALGHHITEGVNGQGCVVRDDGLGYSLLVATPQRPADQVLALARGKITQSKDAAANPQPVAALDVIVLLAVGVPGPPGLGRRKVAALSDCGLVESVRIFPRISLYLQKPYI